MSQATATKTDWRTTDPRIVDRLMKGSVDLHCHSGPSVMNRYFDHYEAMLEAASAGMRALLLKDHGYSTTPVTLVLNKHFGDCGVELLSGVPLNNPSGGLNIHAVDHGIKLGARLVWMPTYSAANHIAHAKAHEEFKDQFPKTRTEVPPDPISILDANGRLVPELGPILDLIAAEDVVLSSGHLSVRECFMLFEEAKRRGVKRLMCNHPTFIIGATVEDVRQLAAMGVNIEHSSCMYTPGSKYMFFTTEDLKELVDAAGVDRTILGSDLGIFDNMRLVEGCRGVIEVCLDLGFSEDEIRMMTAINAARLIGLDDPA